MRISKLPLRLISIVDQSIRLYPWFVFHKLGTLFAIVFFLFSQYYYAIFLNVTVGFEVGANRVKFINRTFFIYHSRLEERMDF